MVQVSDLRPGAARAQIRRLEERVAELESDLTELRRHQVRLAEIVDVVQELLVPLSGRDEAAAAEAIERFQRSL
ncbi:DUF6752 domain-containing protein [Nocardioides sp. GXZ039]|uniref:DUF6752 domain-containing protein n=1 Tax=Nocardioides sp. GXZ039 TaxID=3136018 RepID=UPI0030F45FA9